jgi:uncharacterized protein
MSPFSILAIYIVTGSAAGYLAGLFGIGGGVIMVPVLTMLFQQFSFPNDLVIKLSVGTSMAVVAVTAVVSTRTHNKNGNVDWVRVKALSPAVLIGVIGGALIGVIASRMVLSASVAIFELVVAAQFLYESIFVSALSLGEEPRRIPAGWILSLSSLVGAISSVVGIGGGTLFVPLLNFCGTELKRAIGTAAALGIPVGFAGSLIYLAVGSAGIADRPMHTIGFVYVPAFCGCVIGSIWTTAHGANLAKGMNARNLKMTFAIVLLIAATKMIVSMMK